MGKRRIFAAGAAVVLALGVAVSGQGTSGGPAPAAAAPMLSDDIRLNQIQTVGSHNSYHLLPPQAEVDLRKSVIGDANDLMMYRHAPLAEQFGSQKVRQIELDVFLGPAGGKYATPLLRTVAGSGPYDPAMNEPGMKVLHVQDVDYASSCLSLKACLTQVKAWSDANPTHVPIAILLELKDDEVPISLPGLNFVVPDHFTAASMDALDAEIRSVMGPDDLITPDDVRGSHATLEEAVLTDGWPTLGESRGKVMFLMDNEGAPRTLYRAGAPNLEGRVLFTNSSPGNPDAAFIKMNDSSNVTGIQDAVRAGYIVRTRSDGETVEARANNTVPRDNALASGAQWVSTDYPVPDYGVDFDTPFFVEIPGGTVARCNPVNAPPDCVSAYLEADPVVETTTSTSTTTTTTTASSTTSSTSTTTLPFDPTSTSTTSTTSPPGWTSVSPATGARPYLGVPYYTG